jgi:alpha-ketoglutarate-dependent taurine dioxygenase
MSTFNRKEWGAMSDILDTPVGPRQAWRGAELIRTDAWIDVLTAEEREGLARTANALPDDPNQWIHMDRAALPAPELDIRALSLCDELENGRGFVLIRGLDPHLPMLELKKQYWALCVHLGAIVPQNAKGELLGSVMDKGSRYLADVHARGYTSNDEMFFHSDAGDAVSLLCVRQAMQGGANAIVSMMTVYNAVLREAPHIMPLLYRGFPIYIREEGKDVMAGGEPVRRVTNRRFPVFSFYKGRLSGGINFKSVRAVPQITGVPFLPEEQEALDILEAIANREGNRLEFFMQPGDIMIVNNYMVLHKRYRFEDYAEPERKRLLLRFWLNLHNGRELEPGIAASLRAGFAVTPVMEAA